jgi:hypothetical protein
MNNQTQNRASRLLAAVVVGSFLAHGAEAAVPAADSEEWERTAEGRLEPRRLGQGLPQAKRVEDWREDLHVYATELPAKHCDFRKLIPRERFIKEVAELASAVPDLSDQQMVLRLMRLTASLGVAHTRVFWPVEVGCSIKKFRLITNSDPASLEPDIIVRQSFGDFMAGRDPVLDSVLK